MELYLIRHADALDSEDDFARQLSSRGRGQIDRMVKFFRANDILKPEDVWHSPLVRARETAQLLGEGLGWTKPFRKTAILEPDRDPQEVIAELTGVTRGLALVGHEPLLSALGTLLVSGSPWPLAFTMRKGDVLALERGNDPSAPWIERWHLGPKMIGPSH